MKECPKCLMDLLVTWWMEYDRDENDDFENVEAAIEVIANAMMDGFFLYSTDLCDIHREEQEEQLGSHMHSMELLRYQYELRKNEPETQNQTQS